MIKSRAKQLAKLSPMAHQAISLKHDATTPIVFDASDPGTGKTAVRIWAFAARRRKRGGCMLVLAKRSLLTSVWANDFKKFAPDMKVSVATAANRAAAFAVDADVYITNHDAAKWLAAQKKPFWDRFSERCVDESTKYKHATSQRSRAVAKINKHFKFRSCLTGSPNPVSITDVWHQAFLLDDGKRLGPSFYAFRNSVCEPEQVSRNANAINWVDKDGAEEAVFSLLSDITVRHKFEDCVDIPPNTTRPIDYVLTPKVRKAYDMMEWDHLLPMLKQQVVPGVISRLKGQKIPALTGVNAAAVGTKLLQIASGAVYDNDGKVHVIDNDRCELVLDLIEEREHSLVFYFWQHQLTALMAEAESRKIKFATMNGAMTDAARNAAEAGYQQGRYQTMFAHPEITAHGFTLTRGTATIWPLPTSNLEWWVQGNRRQYRIGQTRKTENIVLVGDNNVEKRVYYDILMGKDKRMKTFLDLFSEWTQDFKAVK